MILIIIEMYDVKRYNWRPVGNLTIGCYVTTILYYIYFTFINIPITTKKI